MKTTTDNHIDKLLHEAMKQRAAKVPPLADDFAEKVLGSLTPRPLQKKRELKFWPLVVAACMVGFVVIFLASPKSAEEQSPLALEEPEVNSQEPIADSQLSTPLKGRLGSLELPLNVATAPQRGANPHSRRRERLGGGSQQPTVVKPKRTPKRKQVVLQRPVEEPLLAEAEVNASHLEEIERGAAEDVHPIHPEMNDPYLAIMEQVKDIRSRGERVRQEVAQLIDKH